MTREEFVENIRQEIREEGFMAATKLVARVAGRAEEFGIKDNPMRILEELPCEDIRVIEYCNWMTKDYRRKDLYYFLPAGKR